MSLDGWQIQSAKRAHKHSTVTPYVPEIFRLQQPPGARKIPIRVSNLDKVQDLMSDPEYVMKDFQGRETQVRQNTYYALSDRPPANYSFEPSSSRHSADLRARVEQALRGAWDFDPMASSTSAARQSNHGGLLGFTPEEYRYLTGLKIPRVQVENTESQASFDEAKEKLSWQISPSESGDSLDLDDEMVHQQIDDFYGPEEFETDGQHANERFKEGSIATTWLSLPERGTFSKVPLSSRCDTLSFIDSGIYMDENYEETPKFDTPPNKVTLPVEVDPEDGDRQDLVFYPTFNVKSPPPRKRSALGGLRLFGDNNEIEWEGRQEAPYDFAGFVSAESSPARSPERAESNRDNREMAQEFFDRPRAPVAFMGNFQNTTPINVPPQSLLLTQDSGQASNAAQAPSSTGQSPYPRAVGLRPYPSPSIVLRKLQHAPNQGIFGSMAMLNSPRTISLSTSVKPLPNALSRPKTTRIHSTGGSSLATPLVADIVLGHNSSSEKVTGNCVHSSPIFATQGGQIPMNGGSRLETSHPGSQSGSKIDLDGFDGDSPATLTEDSSTPHLEDVSLIPSPVMISNADSKANNDGISSTPIPIQKRQPVSTKPPSPSTPLPTTPKANTNKTTPFQPPTPYYTPLPISSPSSPTPAPRPHQNSPTKQHQPLPHSFPQSPKKLLHNSVKNVFRSPKLTSPEHSPAEPAHHDHPIEEATTTTTAPLIATADAAAPTPSPAPHPQIAQAVLVHPTKPTPAETKNARATSGRLGQKGAGAGVGRGRVVKTAPEKQQQKKKEGKGKETQMGK